MIGLLGTMASAKILESLLSNAPKFIDSTRRFYETVSQRRAANSKALTTQVDMTEKRIESLENRVSSIEERESEQASLLVGLAEQQEALMRSLEIISKQAKLAVYASTGAIALGILSLVLTVI